MKRLFAGGAAFAVLAAVVVAPQSAYATQALNAGKKISTTSAKLLNKTGTLSGSQQNLLICDPATPLNGSTSVDYDGFNVHLEDIIAGPGYQIDYNHSWVQLTSFFGEGELKSGPTAKSFLPDDGPGITYQKLGAYLNFGAPFGTEETGYIQVKFTATNNPDDPPGPFNTSGEYTGFSGNTYDLSQYDVVDTDGIQSAGDLHSNATVEFDNYLAVFTTYTEDPLTYTHYSNPDGPGGEDLLTDPLTGTVYGSVPGGENKGTVEPSTVSTAAPEPTSAALILIGGCVLAGRRRRA